MHFVVVERSATVSGGTTYLLLVAEALVRRGHRFTLAAWPGPLSKSFAAVGAALVPTLCWPFNLPQIAWFLRHHPPDAFICGNRARVRHAAVALSRRHGVPCICVLHDPPRPHDRPEDYRRYSAMLSMEGPIRDRVLAGGVPPERVCLAPRPIRTRPLAGRPARGGHVVHLGRLSTQKTESALALVAAVPRLRASMPEVTVSVVGGGGRLQAVASAARAANDACGATVVDVVGETADPLTWIERADVVVAGGYSCMEALYNGRPAIGSGFGWFGPVTQANVEAGTAVHFGDRSSEPVTSDRIVRAIQEVRDDLVAHDASSRFWPRRTWFAHDHSADHAAEILERLAMDPVGAA